MKVWLVLPAYNEELGLPDMLNSLAEVFSEDNRDYSIVIVNDGSTDQTAKVIQDFSKKYPIIDLPNPKNMGLAETLKRGLIEAASRASEKDVIITMDADNTHPAGLTLRMIRMLREGSDVVIASRYRDGSRVLGLQMYRRFLSWVASWMFRVLYPTPGVRDYTCGYRAYRASVIKDLLKKYHGNFITERGFSCMVDILLRMRLMDIVMVEVPLILRYDMKEGASKMKVITTIMDTLKLMIRRKLGSN